MSELIHPHPDERSLLLMKMAADRTRLSAGARLAGYEGELNRDQMRDKVRIYGLAVAVAAVVFAVVMRRGTPRRNPMPLIARVLRNAALLSRLARYLPQAREAIARARAHLDERRRNKRDDQDEQARG